MIKGTRFTSLLIMLSFFSINRLVAQTEDKNIVIESKTDDFDFEKAKGDHPVEIKEKESDLYRCNDFRTSIYFGEGYNEKETIDDVSIKVNGRKAKEIQPQYDYYSVEDIFYSDAKVCHFVLPFTEMGTNDEVKVEKTYLDPRYFTSIYFNESHFLENGTVSLYIPRWMKVELKEYNLKDYSIKKSTSYDDKNDADIITYTISNLPVIKSESSSPGGTYFLPHILVLCKQAMLDQQKITYFNTLDDQYKWYHQLVLQVEDDSSSLVAKAKEITTGAVTDQEKVKMIFDWVQHNIRYLAFEDGIAGFKPANAIDVLNKRYGDCKGMANLTKSLLRSLGYDARLCWLGTNHIAYDYSTPSLAVDNHMICAWFYKGKKYFLDATETNIGINEYAERIQGRQVLIENGDSYFLEKIPATTPEQNLQVEKDILSFDEETTLKGNVSIIYKGESRSDILSDIQLTKTDNLNDLLIKYLSEANLDYGITNLKTSDLAKTDSVLKSSYDLSQKNAASSFGDEIYVDLDFRKEWDGWIIDSTRVTDKMLPYKTHLITEVELTLPTGYKVSQLPSDINLHSDNADISLTYLQKANKVIYKKEILLKQVLLKKASFAEWNTMINGLSKQYKEQLVLVKQ
jgi:hypothetical protein